MAFPANLLIDLVDAGADRGRADEIGASFFRALGPFGVRAIFARCFMPGSTECKILSRMSPPGWEALYSEREFANVNYLERELARRFTPFAWSEIRLLNQGERRLQQALRDNGFSDGLAIPWHGPSGARGVTSLAFERLDAIAPYERRAIEMAALILHQRMQASARITEPVAASPLSPRERECLVLVAQGYADHEIADRLLISTTTAITHIQKARQKLGSRTRAQAVAAAMLKGLI